LTVEVLEAVAVVDYFRCCCFVLILVALVAKLQVRQMRQVRLDRLGRLDPDPHYYYCLLFFPSTLASPLDWA
jgi:hypothetical protein